MTSGSATVTQNGNSFTVTPSSDCTVRINFAAKTTVTVTYMADETLYMTASGYAGDPITLPSTAIAVTDWTLFGWSTSTVIVVGAVAAVPTWTTSAIPGLMRGPSHQVATTAESTFSRSLKAFLMVSHPHIATATSIKSPALNVYNTTFISAYYT